MEGYHLIIRILSAGDSPRLTMVSRSKLSNNGIIQFGLSNNDVVQYIGLTDCSEEAVKLTKSQQPDIVLMDAHIGGIGSIEATKRIIKMRHNPAVIGISTIDDPIYPQFFFNAGAMGFIHANDKINNILNAIQTVKQGRIYQSQLTSAQTQLPISNKSQPFILLTERELQVAMMTAEGDDHKLIAKKLDVSIKSIQTYKTRILKKLNISNDVELSHHAIKHNLIHIYNGGHNNA